MIISEKAFKLSLLQSFIMAALTSVFLYWTDEDPPYRDTWHTVKEVTIITSIFFSAFLMVILSTKILLMYFKKLR